MTYTPNLRVKTVYIYILKEKEKKDVQVKLKSQNFKDIKKPEKGCSNQGEHMLSLYFWVCINSRWNFSFI